ncbi:MAG: TlpA disulfide reductase family protein [Planctomycetota bacterium]
MRHARIAALLVLFSACSDRTEATRIVDGKGVQEYVEAHRGKPLLINFWASWCVPCCEEMPDLISATRDFRAHGGQVVGIAMECMVADVTKEAGLVKARERAKQLGINFPVLVCSEPDIFALRELLGAEVGELPGTLVIDRAGVVVELHDGKATQEEFAKLCLHAQR